jgi:hypothetical protein
MAYARFKQNVDTHVGGIAQETIDLFIEELRTNDVLPQGFDVSVLQGVKQKVLERLGAPTRVSNAIEAAQIEDDIKTIFEIFQLAWDSMRLVEGRCESAMKYPMLHDPAKLKGLWDSAKDHYINAKNAVQKCNTKNGPHVAKERGIDTQYKDLTEFAKKVQKVKKLIDVNNPDVNKPKAKSLSEGQIRTIPRRTDTSHRKPTRRISSDVGHINVMDEEELGEEALNSLTINV